MPETLFQDGKLVICNITCPYCHPKNTGPSNGIFFCTMFTDELFNSAKPIPCLLLGSGTENKVNVTLSSQVFLHKQNKSSTRSAATHKNPKQLCGRLEVGPNHSTDKKKKKEKPQQKANVLITFHSESLL